MSQRLWPSRLLRRGLTCLLLGCCLCPVCPTPAGATSWAGPSLFRDGRPHPNPWSSLGVHTERVVATRFRAGVAEGERTLQITVWYRAEPDTGRRHSYGDYFDLAASELAPASESTLTAAREGYYGFMTSHGLAREAVTTWFATRMGAVADAVPVVGKYPLVVIAQGNGESAVDQCSLAESLVGAGFVVATCPSATRVDPPRDESDLGRCAEEQADDIALLVDQVAKRADVEPARIGIVGHSLGARGALLFAMRDHRVRVLISLDGGIGTAAGRAAMEGAPSFQSRRLSSNVYHFYETLDAFMKPDFTLLSELSGSSVWVMRVPDLHHQHFTSLGAWIERVHGLLDATHGFAAGGRELVSEEHPGTVRSFQLLDGFVRESLIRSLSPIPGQPNRDPGTGAWAPDSPHAPFEFELLPRPR